MPGTALEPAQDPPEPSPHPTVHLSLQTHPPPPRVSGEVWALNSFTADRGTGEKAGPGLGTHFGGLGLSAP